MTNERTVTVKVGDALIPTHIGDNLGALLSDRVSDAGGSFAMPCGGHGRCGKCRVKVTGGVSPLTERERSVLSEREIEEGVRLACLTSVTGDCEVTPCEAGGQSQIRADGTLPAFSLSPMFCRFGAALDIGTTTLAARLYDPAGRLLAEMTELNPESAWGADVISRMEACLAGHAAQIAETIRSAADGMLTAMASEAGIRAEEIDAMVITGNTVMLHLLTGDDVEPMTHAPFQANRLFGEFVTAGEIGLSALSPDVRIYLPPCAAAFVGADISTALLASEICRSERTAVLVDIGTNGEMMLWHRGELHATSTAAGPAFEGAGISMGMGGRAGAVDRVKVEDGEIAAHVIGDAAPVGICGSGLVDAVACLLAVDALDETGFLEDDPAMIADPVCLTQDDIRQVQLAKSAIHAGMRTLLAAAGVDCGEVEELAVAGGFGSYLDIHNAVAIGLLPEELGDRVRVLGNAALAGASMLLLAGDLRGECEARARGVKMVALAANPVFAAEYMERMMF